jgi:hypothetical protein
MTTSVSIDGKISFAGNTYAISKDSVKYIDAIVEAALLQKGDLVAQYKTHEPFFASSGLIRHAASDIKEVRSLVSSYLLDSNSVLVTLLESKRGNFIVAESRDSFGYYRVRITALPCSSTSEVLGHPYDLTVQFREGVFRKLGDEDIAHTYLQIRKSLQEMRSSPKYEDLFALGDIK